MTGRAGLATVFLRSAEYRFNLVRAGYARVLHRDAPPTSAEVAAWAGTGLDSLSLRVAFKSTYEFYLLG